MAAPRKIVVDLDLDALDKEARATEGPQTPFTFRLHGITFSMTSGDDSDFRVLDELAKNNLPEAFRLLLGDAQYEKFVSKPVSMRTLKTLMNGWYEHKGTSTGE